MPNCTFLATKDKAVLQAAAILRLHRAGFVEPVRPSRAAYHILAHQLLAMAIEREGVARDRWWPELEGATAFAEIRVDEREAIVEHMLARGILAETSAKLWLGPKGERLYGRRNFAELYAVFSTPKLINVRWNERELGTLDAQFFAGNDDEPGRSTFTLAGRAWKVVHIDWRRAVCLVEPTDQARNTRWSGAPQYLGYELCQAMREILIVDDEDSIWSKRAREVIATMRREHEFSPARPRTHARRRRGDQLVDLRGRPRQLVVGEADRVRARRHRGRAQRVADVPWQRGRERCTLAGVVGEPARGRATELSRCAAAGERRCTQSQLEVRTLPARVDTRSTRGGDGRRRRGRGCGAGRRAVDGVRTPRPQLEAQPVGGPGPLRRSTHLLPGLGPRRTCQFFEVDSRGGDVVMIVVTTMKDRRHFRVGFR